MQFECPKCGGNEFGTAYPHTYDDKSKAKGQCHSPHCDYEWSRSDDKKLGVFGKPRSELNETIKDLQQQIKTLESQLSEKSHVVIPEIGSPFPPGLYTSQSCPCCESFKDGKCKSTKRCFSGSAFKRTKHHLRYTSNADVGSVQLDGRELKARGIKIIHNVTERPSVVIDLICDVIEVDQMDPIICTNDDDATTEGGN